MEREKHYEKEGHSAFEPVGAYTIKKNPVSYRITGKKAWIALIWVTLLTLAIFGAGIIISYVSKTINEEGANSSGVLNFEYAPAQSFKPNDIIY